MSNKDFLKLENEFRNELPVYKEKPKITSITKPVTMTKKISAFLAKAKESDNTGVKDGEKKSDETVESKHVEMDVYITSM